MREGDFSRKSWVVIESIDLLILFGWSQERKGENRDENLRRKLSKV
jgi:hypothetical protein